MSLIKKFNGEAIGYNSCRGIIGALAAIGETLESDHTYELIAYRTHDNLGSQRKVDAASIYKAGMPMGTFALMDFTGLDIAYHVAEYMEEKEPNFKVSPLVKEKMDKGEIGVKAGKGFYTYPEKGTYEIRMEVRDSGGLTNSTAQNVELQGRRSCIASKVLGEHDPRLNVLRKFRDEILMQSDMGRQMVDVYYGSILLGVILTKPDGYVVERADIKN
jgi:hypothetical protein